jgi:hypothetical protein
MRHFPVLRQRRPEELRRQRAATEIKILHGSAEGRVVSSMQFISGDSRSGTSQLSDSERTWPPQMRRTLR